MSLPDELWTKIMREWVQDAVDWSQWSQTCRHFYRNLPRPRPLQLITPEVRYPHVLFLEEITSVTSDTTKEELRLLCFNDDHDYDGPEREQGAAEDQKTSLMRIICQDGKHFRIFTYCDGDKAYLEPFFYNSSFHCEKEHGGERNIEGYGLVCHYEAAPVKALYASMYHPNLECYWQIRQRGDLPYWMELTYGDEGSSMMVDFDSFFKAFLLIGGAVWVDCRLEDYRADLPFFVSLTPPIWHDQWRRRLYQALPCQPRPFASHAYQTSLFAPESWEGVEYEHDRITDFILTGHRTAVVTFSMELRDSNIIIRSPPQSFALRMPLLQQDMKIFTSSDPAAWLSHLFERRSRRWYVARKYWRVAADVQETHREVPVEAAVRDWPILHPDYIYRIEDGDFVLELPTIDIAKDSETGELLQGCTDECVLHGRSWCVVLHG